MPTPKRKPARKKPITRAEAVDAFNKLLASGSFRGLPRSPRERPSAALPQKPRTVTRSAAAQAKNRKLKAAKAVKAAVKTTPRKAALASLGGEQIGAEVASGSTMGGWQRVMKEMNKRRLAARKATVVRAGGRWPKKK